jgi:hypothetical protein
MESRRNAHAELAGRLREIREEIYGLDSIPVLSEALGIPAWTWSNFESGVVIPGLLLLRFMALTGAHPRWLLTGEGPKFLGPGTDPVREPPQP